jgi:adenylate cyclase
MAERDRDVSVLRAYDAAVKTEPARVLVVDDHPQMRALLSRLLKRYGHEPELATCGAEALARLARGGIDLVLLDLFMPDIDGREVLRLIKADPAIRQTPVVIVSGVDDTPVVAACIAEGADDYLTKPFNGILLAARIESSLAKKRLDDLQRKYVAELEMEDAKNHRLIASILPAPIALRLKEGERTIAEPVNDVTVLFADLVGFTRLSLELAPDDLIQLLSSLFSVFDRLSAEHGVEKIKTIGDAYLAVGGLSSPSDDHTMRVARLATAMRDAVRGIGDTSLRLRIGIHAGPTIAGVLGTDKLFFDLWGATVNLASRLESHGEPDRIQVSAEVKERLAGHYELTPRGMIDLKGIGPIETWFLGASVD